MTSISIASAVCASHPDSPATFSCSRCGAFACEACRGLGDEALCSACAVRTGTDRKLDVGEALEGGVRALVRRPGQALALVAVQVAGALLLYPVTAEANARMAAAGSNAGEVFFESLPRLLLGGSLGYLLSAFLYSVYILFEASVAAGQERPMGALLREGARRFPSVLGATLLFSLAITVGLVMCVGPGLFLIVALGLCLHAAVLGGAGPIDALGVSWRLTEGHRLRMFGVVLAVGILAVVVGLLGMGISRVLVSGGMQFLAHAITNVTSGLFLLFWLGAMGEAYRQLGGAQAQR